MTWIGIMVRLLVGKKCNIIFIMYKSEIYFFTKSTIDKVKKTSEYRSEPVTGDPKHKLYYK